MTWMRRFAVLPAIVAVACFAAPVSAATAQPEEKMSVQIASAGVGLDLKSLKKELRAAKGVGLLDKLAMANRLSSFTEEFDRFHSGASATTLAELRTEFETLHARIGGLVKPGNPRLHDKLVAKREALWTAFADRQAFQTGIGKAHAERRQRTGGDDGYAGR